MSSKSKKASPTKKSGKSANKKNVSPSKQTKTKNQKETLPDIIDNKPSKIPLKPQPKNFKQIEYKVDENKLYLVDYNNNGFECNLFGEKLPSFNDNISGISSYKQRHLLNKIKPLTFEYQQLYHPLNQNFEGYFPYPRPLSLPFINECANPSLFTKELHNEKRFRTQANQRIIKLKIPSKENQFKLTYLTSSIHLNETETKKYLLNLINNHINTLLKQNKFYEERIMKSKNVIALLKFKKILQSNLNDNEVNGKRLQSAPKEYKETFNIIKDLIHKKLLRKSRSTHKVMDEVYKEMYSIRNVPNKHYNTIMTEHTRNEPSLLPTKSTNDTQPQSHTISDVDEVKGRNVKGVTFHNITTHTATTGFGLTTNRFKQTFFDDVNRKEDLSFLSVEEIPVDDGKNKKVYKGDENLVNGWFDYQKVQKDFYQTAKLFRPAGASYLKEIAMLQKVNPIAYKKEEMKEKADMESYQKKKKGKLIYEKIKIKK